MAPTARNQLWVFGLCAYTMALGQLKRLGAITGIAPGPRNKARAIFAGLVALAKHTTTPVRVMVQLTTVWEAWTQPHHRQPYLDLLADLTVHDTQRLTVLYVSRNTSSPEAPGSQPQLYVIGGAPSGKRPWTQIMSRYTNMPRTTSPRSMVTRPTTSMKRPHVTKGKQTKQYKKEWANQCRKPWTNSHHRREPHRSGFHCSACGARMHPGLTASVLETIGDQRAPPSAQAPNLPKKATRAQTIKDLLVTDLGNKRIEMLQKRADTTDLGDKCVEMLHGTEKGGQRH